MCKNVPTQVNVYYPIIVASHTHIAFTVVLL